MRRVCVFTGSRADYGPLLAVLRALQSDPDIDLVILATGGHLVASQGLTARQIEADGFRIDERVDVVLASDSSSAVAKSFALGVAGYADALDRLNPDMLLLLGDRYEALAAAVTASLRLLPIGHISGGELSYGSTDDASRHAITKLAHLHFTANETFRQRVIQMGEDPARVYATGVPSLDTIRTTPPIARRELAAKLGIELSEPLITVTYHPATADPEGSRDGLHGLLKALECFPEASVVFTATNVDQNAASIFAPIRQYSSSRPERAMMMPSLGQATYLSLVRESDVVVGNSSSGLVEAPALGTPTVNIGTRQDGRPRATSVVDCGETAADIESAIHLALTPEHQRLSQTATSPFGDGYAADRIVDVLKTVDLDQLVPKRFFDAAVAEHRRVTAVSRGHPRRGLLA